MFSSSSHILLQVAPTNRMTELLEEETGQLQLQLHAGQQLHSVQQSEHIQTLETMKDGSMNWYSH